MLSACGLNSDHDLKKDDFYFFMNGNKIYIPQPQDVFVDDYGHFVMMSILQDYCGEAFYTERGLTIGDPASKIFELYENLDWYYYLNYYETLFRDYDESERETARTEFEEKIKAIKNKKEYKALVNAQELIENEKSIIGDDEIYISLMIFSHRYGDRFLTDFLFNSELIQIYSDYDVSYYNSPEEIQARLGDEKYEELKKEEEESNNKFYTKNHINKHENNDVTKSRPSGSVTVIPRLEPKIGP
jgi:hypothetical protein